MGRVQGIIHLGQGLVVRTLTMQGSIGGHSFSTCKISDKLNISYPLIRKRRRAYQACISGGKKFYFFEKFYVRTEWSLILPYIPAGIHLFKDNNRNTRIRCEICWKLTKTPKQRHWRRSGVFIVNFEYISHLVLVFLLLTKNM